MSVDIRLEHSPLFVELVSKLHIREELRLYFGLLLTLSLGYAVILAIYRLYFHPLARFPGPPLAAVTKAYYHYHLVRGDAHTHALELHNKYGPVVRFAPNQLLYVDGLAWKDIYGHRTSGKKPNRKQLTTVVYPGHESMIQAISEDNHARQRRIFSNAFSEQALRKQEPMFKKYVNMLIRNLEQQSAADGQDKKFDLVNHYNFTTFDVMGDLTFAESLGMLEKSEYSPWVSKVFTSVKVSILLYVARQYSFLNYLLHKTILPAMIEERKAHFNFSNERVDRRLEKGSDNPDIWKLVMEQKGDRVLTTKEMYSNAALFMLAGTETTSTLLSGLSYYLMKNPAKLQKLRAELDEAFPGGRGITSEKLAHLKYLQACLEEALRIYPPVPNAMLRIAPDEGTVICGEFVPGDTRLGVTQYAINHSSLNFALPDEFHPERWMTEGDDRHPVDMRFANDKKAAKQSFSFGPRNCLGRNMAWFEMRLIAAQMILTFDMELCPESEGWHNQKVFTLWQKNPLMVKLTKREGIDTVSE